MTKLAQRDDVVKMVLRRGGCGWAVVGLEGPVLLFTEEDEAIIAASDLNDISEKHGLRCPYWTEWRGSKPRSAVSQSPGGGVVSTSKSADQTSVDTDA